MIQGALHVTVLIQSSNKYVFVQVQMFYCFVSILYIDDDLCNIMIYFPSALYMSDT